MMSQKKIEKRRRKKAKKEVRQKERELTLARRQAFPEVIYQTNGASELLVAEVKHILGKLVDSPNLDKSLRRGLEKVRTGDCRTPRERGILSLRLGDFIYNHLDVNFQAIHRMAYDVEFDLGGRNRKQLTVIFRCLEKVTNHIFCSPKHFVADFQGQQLVVAFKSHAIERIGERTVVNPNRYADRGKTFAFTYRYRYFDFAELANGGPAIRIWDFCNPEQFLADVHADLLGTNVTARKVAGFPFFAKDGKICYYLVGYCPIEQHASLPGYLVLATLLRPGMENTPEFSKYVRSRRADTRERMEFGKRVGRATYAGLQESRDFDLIRILHEFEPQVKSIGEEVFSYPERSIVKLALKMLMGTRK